MNELYWITRLDGVRGVFIVLAVCSLIYVFVCLINEVSANECAIDDEEENEIIAKFIKHLKRAIAVFCVCVIALVAIPSTEEALLIYGVGSALDYVQDNPKAQQLPEKAIEALDRYLENNKNLSETQQ